MCRRKIKTRPPTYEPQIIGATARRASTSWHFLRRGFVSNKQKRLKRHCCDEDEFRRTYLSDESSDGKAGSSDSDDSVESNDSWNNTSLSAPHLNVSEEDSCSRVSLANKQGFCEHIQLRKFSDQCDESMSLELSSSDEEEEDSKMMVKRSSVNCFVAPALRKSDVVEQLVS